jgi:hypothetical protein
MTCAPPAFATLGSGRRVLFAAPRSSGDQHKHEDKRAMMYVLTFGGDSITLEALPPDDAERATQEIRAWWSRYRRAGKILAGAKLVGPFSATIVRFVGGRPVIQDGPFTTEYEAIGGFGIIDVADLNEALALAQSWPLGGYVEIRPLMSPVRASDMVGFPQQAAKRGHAL